MSIILKALQRAERERQYTNRESSASVFWSSSMRARRSTPVAAVMLAVALAAGAGVWSLGAGKTMPERPEREASRGEPQQTAPVPVANAVPPAPVRPEDASGVAAILTSLPAPAAELRAQAPEMLFIPEGTAWAASFQGFPEANKAVAALPPATVTRENQVPEDLKSSTVVPSKAPAEAEKAAEPKESLNDAIAHFVAALRERPSHAPTHAALGRLYARKGSYIQAINELRLATELAPGDSESLYALSVLYARLGNAQHARHYLEQAIRKDTGVRQRALGEREFGLYLADPQFQALIGTTAENHRP